jgi:KDO2-lipid IV(A) lauroyltransferase
MVLACGHALGLFWFWCIPIRKKTALENLHKALKDTHSTSQQHTIAQRSFIHLATYALEGVRIPHLNRNDLQKTFTIHHEERIQEALAHNRGVIMITAHIGHFDMLGCVLATKGYTIHAVVKEFSSKSIQAFWKRLRENTGLRLIGTRKTKHVIYDVLKQNGIVGLLIDQHMAPHRSILCSFFNRPAATTPAPVRFAYETGAIILPVVTYRADTPGQHVAYIEPPWVLENPFDNLEQNIHHNTQRLNAHVEQWILKAPEQWFWVHKRWKAEQHPSLWKTSP